MAKRNSSGRSRVWKTAHPYRCRSDPAAIRRKPIIASGESIIRYAAIMRTQPMTASQIGPRRRLLVGGYRSAIVRYILTVASRSAQASANAPIGTSGWKDSAESGSVQMPTNQARGPCHSGGQGETRG